MRVYDDPTITPLDRASVRYAMREMQERERNANPVDVRIRFLKVWGHPTRDLIMGGGDTALVSRRIADLLIRDGYAEEIKREGA